MKKTCRLLSLLLALTVLCSLMTVVPLNAEGAKTGIKFTANNSITSSGYYIVNTACTGMLTADDVTNNVVSKSIEVYNLNNYAIQVSFNMQITHNGGWAGPYEASKVTIPAKTGKMLTFSYSLNSEGKLKSVYNNVTGYYPIENFFPRLNFYNASGKSSITIDSGDPSTYMNVIVRGLPDSMIGKTIAGSSEKSVTAEIPSNVTLSGAGLPDESEYALVSLENAEGFAGNTVDVDIVLSQNPGLKNLNLQLTYPTQYLTLTGVTNKSIFTSLSRSSSQNAQPYALSFSGGTGTGTGPIATLTFAIDESAPKSELLMLMASTAATLIDNTQAYKHCSGASLFVKHGYLIGDVNGDGDVNSLDRIRLARYLAGWTGADAQVDAHNADVNNDGLVDSRDRILLSRYVANWDSAKGYFVIRPEVVPGITYKMDESQFVELSYPVIEEVLGNNLIPQASSNFNSVTSVSSTAWKFNYISSAKVSIVSDGYSGKALKFTDTSYKSPDINLATYIKAAGTYRISFRYKIAGEGKFDTVIRTNKVYSFSEDRGGGNFYHGFAGASNPGAGNWGEYSLDLAVTAADINSVGSGYWRFCMHQINDTVTGIWIDDFEVRKVSDNARQTLVTEAKTWVANEILLVSSKTYANPYTDVDVDLILTNGGVTYTIPGFWDGGKAWRIRFVCPTAGTWTYRTVCTDTTDAGLHNVSGSVNCTPYDGDLAIYQHGFVKAVPNQKYFVYDDGTPFFYLGDTHWSLGDEPLDHIQTMTSKRVEQGYTVIQSEPIGCKFKVSDGSVDDTDIEGFHINDTKFMDIASKGLVHANAEFFFPSEMRLLVESTGGYSDVCLGYAHFKGTIDGEETEGDYPLYDLADSAKAALARLSRYWVARYSAYPVMWTLGQEVDDDFYWNRTNNESHPQWGYINNPYKLVAEYIAQYDPYTHPLSAHQEGASSTQCSTSAFRDVEAHTWYAAQWSDNYNKQVPDTIPRDYWNNGQGKPVIDYEEKYCYLWTKNFGARLQGYMAYLNGMFGYGWGGQDTWSYTNTYNEDAQSSDGVDIITPEDKQNATWQDSLEYDSAYQVGYMRYFFEEIVGDWYNLVPRFNDDAFLEKESGVFAFMASKGNKEKAVIYFYNFSDTSLVGENGMPNATKGDSVKTGVVKQLTPNAQYHYLWFNPVSGEVAGEGTFTASSTGSWNIGLKNTTDMVLYLYK